MTDTPRAPACPEWAMQWSPRNWFDASALELYHDGIIDGIADVLPKGVDAKSVDKDVLAGLLRQWASQHIEFHRRASSDTATHVRDQLKAAAAKWRKAAAAADELPDIAKSWMAAVRPVGNGGHLDWIRNLGRVQSKLLSASRELEGLAALAEKTAKAAQIKRGRRSDDEKQRAVNQLCWIYEIVTGRLPGRLEDSYGKRDCGPFEAFVEASIKPLWPNAGQAERYIRVAARWYKKRRSDA